MKRIITAAAIILFSVSALVPVQVLAAEESSWSDAYASYVFDGTFLSSTDPEFFTEEPETIKFGLYDMDLDGIPELIAYDGCGYMAGATNYVFTYKDGKMSYIGDAGFRGSILYFFETGRYPGLFCTDGNMGYLETFYYEIRNGAVEAENVIEQDCNQPVTDGDLHITKVTDQDALYNLVMTGTPVVLDMFSLNEIRMMGWQDFLSHQSSGDGAVVPLPDTGRQPAAEPAQQPNASEPVEQAAPNPVQPAASSTIQPAADSAASYTAPFYGIWCGASKGQADMQAIADRLIQNGYPARVFVTTDWDNLNTEFWYVVTAGCYPSSDAANAALSSVRTLYPDAYVKYSGNWKGSQSYQAPQAPAANTATSWYAPFYGIWCSASKNQADLQGEADKLAAYGLPSQVFVTTDWDNLNPEFWYVLTAGTYASDAAAYSALPQIQAVCPDAYVKYSGNYIGG